MEGTKGVRRVLRWNAALSGLTGAACLVFAEPLSGMLGPDRPGVVRLVGAALVVFAADLVLLARARRRRLLTGARIVAVLDFGWTAGMAGLALSGVLDPVGIALVVATGIATAEFGWLEWTGAARAGRSQVPQEVAA